MSSPTNPVPSLRAMELEVQAEGREWMRRLEQKLQAQADRHGGVSPQSGRKAHHRRREPMRLRSGFCEVALEVCAVESASRQRQCRRKRAGQFWTRAGLRHLDALEGYRDHGHWDQLWLTA